jgi:uncharacterized protein Yka (UPF0111/DUF47 family)
MLHNIEDKLGLPRLSKVIETVDKLPDSKRLKAIKEILDTAERVSQAVPELDKIVSLITVLNELPLEKLKGLEKALKRIEAIIDKAPEDLMQNLVQFIAELKEN